MRSWLDFDDKGQIDKGCTTGTWCLCQGRKQDQAGLTEWTGNVVNDETGWIGGRKQWV
jgi:hypothetical protein